MRSVVVVFLVGCGSNSTPPPSNTQPVPPPPVAAPAPEKKCLPVVAKECGCVYTCGVGTRMGDHWMVTHAFWKDTQLKAKIEQWCVDRSCTDVFAAEIVCGGICAPKPAETSCHFAPGDVCTSERR